MEAGSLGEMYRNINSQIQEEEKDIIAEGEAQEEDYEAPQYDIPVSEPKQD